MTQVAGTLIMPYSTKSRIIQEIFLLLWDGPYADWRFTLGIWVLIHSRELTYDLCFIEFTYLDRKDTEEIPMCYFCTAWIPEVIKCSIDTRASSKEDFASDIEKATHNQLARSRGLSNLSHHLYQLATIYIRISEWFPSIKHTRSSFEPFCIKNSGPQNGMFEKGGLTIDSSRQCIVHNDDIRVVLHHSIHHILPIVRVDRLYIDSLDGELAAHARSCETHGHQLHAYSYSSLGHRSAHFPWAIVHLPSNANPLRLFGKGSRGLL